MRVAAGAQGAVLGLADGIVLGGHPAPVIEGVCQAGLAGPAAHDAPCLAGLPGDRCDAAQGLVVPGVQGGGCLREQCGQDHVPDAWQ